MKKEYSIDYMPSSNRLKRDFYIRDVLVVAPELIGKELIVKLENDEYGRYPITEVEAYRGAEDKACHANRGRTKRTEIMYHEGGKVYVYFVYGMYWMLNIVAGEKNNPQAALIRGIKGFEGPGKLTRGLKIDGTFYGEDLTLSNRIWIEDAGISCRFKTGPRIGIEYAGKFWSGKPWRFFI